MTQWRLASTLLQFNILFPDFIGDFCCNSFLRPVILSPCIKRPVYCNGAISNRSAMTLAFHKYQGTGNDFVMIDNRNRLFDHNDLNLIGRLCDRRFGIGADGVILIEEDEATDFEMVYFNPDGSQSLCGNGSRCAVMFARALGMIGEQTTFKAVDGVHEAEIKGDQVHLLMHDVTEVQRQGDDFIIDTGSPHYIQYVEGLSDMDIVAGGQGIRYSDPFKAEGINVNFVEPLADGQLKIRTYERGVENETLSCGTGCTAVALSAALNGSASPVKLNAQGGELQVSFQQNERGFEQIYLIGPAKKVFEGEVHW